MTIQTWIIYIGFVLIATATPGPAAFFVISNSALYGKKTAFFAALGNISGLLCLGLISVSGLGAILSTSQVIFDIIKYLGAAYLFYVGIKMFLKKDNSLDGLKSNIVSYNSNISVMIFLKALGVAVSNPKAIVFLTALFPQFIDVEKNLTIQFLQLISILLIFSFSFLMSYGLLASQTKQWLTKPKRFKIFNWIGGSIFVGFGLLLAFSSRK